MVTKEEAYNHYREALHFHNNISPTDEETSAYNVMIELLEKQLNMPDYGGAVFTANKIGLLRKAIIRRQADQLSLFSSSSSSLVKPAVYVSASRRVNLYR